MLRYVIFAAVDLILNPRVGPIRLVEKWLIS
jgi:hypothetical protein